MSHVGQTQLIGCIVTAVGHAEDVGQNKVVEGTDKQSLATHGLKLGTVIIGERSLRGFTVGLELVGFLQHGIGHSNGAVARVPHRVGAVAASRQGHILPGEDLVVKLLVGGQVVAHARLVGSGVVHHVVARELADERVVIAHVAIDKQLLQLLDIGQIHASVRHSVQEIVT